jgi:hypothetical protein
MRSNDTAGPWVVYRTPVQGKAGGMTALCSQQEWEEMDRTQPGRYTLIRAGIASEGEAERLARSTPPLPPAPPPSGPSTAASAIPGGGP